MDKTFFPFQVWFQNARAKHRRNQMKSDGDKPDKADNQTSSDNIDDDKHKDSLSMSEITDSQSPIMSDISSSPSLSELHSGHVESDHSTSSLSDLFTNSINSINWYIVLHEPTTQPVLLYLVHLVPSYRRVYFDQFMLWVLMQKQNPQYYILS